MQQLFQTSQQALGCICYQQHLQLQMWLMQLAALPSRV
jgi:hypothetical protein